MKLYGIWTLDDDYYAAPQLISVYRNKDKAETRKVYILKHGIPHTDMAGNIVFINTFTEPNVWIEEIYTADSQKVAIKYNHLGLIVEDQK